MAEQRLLDDLERFSSTIRNGKVKAHEKIQRRIGRIRQKDNRRKQKTVGIVVTIGIRSLRQKYL